MREFFHAIQTHFYFCVIQDYIFSIYISLTTFQEKQKNFFSKTKIVSRLIIYTKYVLSLGWLDKCDYRVFITLSACEEKLLCFRCTQFFIWHRSKWSISLLTYLHWERKLSRWFYIFQRDTQFWYTNISNFYDSFMFLIKWHHFHTMIIDRQVSRQFYDWNEIRNFYQVDILHLLGTIWQNR